MNTLIRFSLLLMSAFVFGSANATDLPNNWSKSYKPGSWQGKCDVGGRGGCRVGSTYYYDASSSILINFTSSTPPPVTTLLVTAAKGTCAGGKITIDGSSTLELVVAGKYCGVAGGKIFRDANRITNKYSQLDIGMFSHAKTIEVDIKLKSGNNLKAEIPMQAFSKNLEAAKVAGGR